MRAGKLRHRVSLLTPLPNLQQDDTFGQPSQAGNVLGVFPVSIEPITGRESVIGNKQLRGDETHKVCMRWQGLDLIITPVMWFMYGARRLNITETMNLEERNREYEILCTEVLTP